MPVTDVLQTLIARAKEQAKDQGVSVEREKKRTLSEQQIRIAHLYVSNGFDYPAAYAKVHGPHRRSAAMKDRVKAMHRPHFMGLVRQLAAPILQEMALRKDEGIALLTAQAWVCISDFAGTDGVITIESIRKLPAMMQRCIKSIEFKTVIDSKTKNADTGEMEIVSREVVKKIELHDSQKAIALVAQILGWQEKDAGGLEGFVDLMQKMQEARQKHLSVVSDQ